MSTEFNYVARLDTTQIMSGIAEIRSQVGMAFASPTGFATPATGISGGGFSGMNNVASAASSQFQQMFSGMQGGQGMFGGTHTNPAMAYSPHYGMNQAQTSLEQEWQIHRGGLAAANASRPPGVSGGEYALGVESNFINRQLDANHAASSAAKASFYAGVGGLAAGEAASALAAPIGALAGGAIAGRMFGAGARGAGAMVGGLAASWFAFDLANDYVGGKIQDHFAEVEQISGTTRELGELAGAGRGLKRAERIELGISARQASKDIGMDVQEMGDILALGRQAGMLPTATDPSKAREQFRDFARTIDEGAQILQTSLAGATQVIKSAVSHGMSAQEGVVRAAGAGGADIWLAQQARMSAFAGAGAATGMSMGFTASQGSSMFTGSMGAGSAAGLSGDEMRIMGGRFGAAQFVGTTQMAMASGPMGNMQLMAAMGGGLEGAGMMDLPGAALSGLMSGGGDFLSNAGKFMVHQNEYRRGIGASGIRTMARQQIEMGGELISQFMPDMSANEAERMYAMSMGMNPDQAKLLVGGGRGGGGGGSSIGGGMGADAQMRAIDAMQMSRLSGVEPGGSGGGPRSFGLGHTVDGAIAGAMVAGPWGAAIGGVAGFVGGNLGAIKDLGGMIFDGGPGIFSSAQEKADYNERKQAAEYDQRMSAAKDRLGYMDVSQGAGSRFLKADLSGARLTLGGVSPLAENITSGTMAAMGLNPVAAGAGTMQIDGKYYSAAQVQKLASQPLWEKQISEKQRIASASAAVETSYGAGLNKKALGNDIALFGALHEMVRTGESQTVTLLEGQDGETSRSYTYDPRQGGKGIYVGDGDDVGAKLLARARGFIEKIDATGANKDSRSRMLGKLDGIGGMMDPEVRSYLEKVTGVKMEGLNGAFMAGRAGAAATQFTVEQTAGAEANYLGLLFGEDIVSTGPAINPKSQLQAKYFKELTQNPYYLAAKDASLKNRDSEAKKLLHEAKVDVLTSSPNAYRNLEVGDIDPNGQHYRPEAEKTAAAVRTATAAAAAMMPGPMGASLLTAVDKDLQKNILQKTSWKEQVKDEAAMLKGLRPPRKKKGPGTLQRAVGFGQQETAMASIQRSLSHVERSLRTMDKRISGTGAQPQASGDAAGTGVVQ